MCQVDGNIAACQYKLFPVDQNIVYWSSLTSSSESLRLIYLWNTEPSPLIIAADVSNQFLIVSHNSVAGELTMKIIDMEEEKSDHTQHN